MVPLLESIIHVTAQYLSAAITARYEFQHGPLSETI